MCAGPPLESAQQESTAGTTRCCTEGANSHTRSGPVLHIHQSRLESRPTPYRRGGAPKEQTARHVGAAVNLSGTKDRGSGSLADVRQLHCY